VPESGHWLVVVRSGGARSVVVCLLVLTFGRCNVLCVGAWLCLSL
jgi:hypothetical protein